MSPLRASMLLSSQMPRTPRQILIFRVVRWMHGKNIVRPHCSPGSTFFDSPFSPSLDYLPVDALSNVAGSVRARVVSRALEVRFDSLRLSGALNDAVSPKQYAFDDFTISQVAKILGNHTDAAKVRIPLAEAFSRPFINLWSSMLRELGTLLTIGIPIQPCPTGLQVSWA